MTTTCDRCEQLQRELTAANEDIAEYTESSKELQDELEKELARMEKSEKDMRVAMELAQGEVEDWKSKYTTTLRDHSSTMSHMQKELESLRQSEKALRTRLRDMELDNDDLEKSEREKDSSLQDLETRYGKSIERIALLEEELVSKAQLEEETQRLKDELRDLQEELGITRAQLKELQSKPPKTGSTPATAPPLATPPADNFATPRKPGSPTRSSPPALSSGEPAPSRSPPPSIEPVSPIPPVPAMRLQDESSTAQAAMNGLSRSTKTRNLASTPAVNHSSPMMANRALRESRTNGMIQDMKQMTDRVKQLTSRLDSRRNLVMAGSGIPRASMSPGSTPGALNRSVARRPSLHYGAAGSSSLSKSVGAGGALGPRPSSRAGGTHPVVVGSTRPPSRSALRMSTSGHQGSASGSSMVPVRPPTRMSSLSAASSTASSSRPTTPVLHARSPTPASSGTMSSSSLRASTTASRASANESAALRTSLGTSTSRRHHHHHYSDHHASSPPPPLPQGPHQAQPQQRRVSSAAGANATTARGILRPGLEDGGRSSGDVHGRSLLSVSTGPTTKRRVSGIGLGRSVGPGAGPVGTSSELGLGRRVSLAGTSTRTSAKSGTGNGTGNGN